MEVLAQDETGGYLAAGELALDGSPTPVAGIRLAALSAPDRHSGIICWAECGGEAARAGEAGIVFALTLLSVVSHFKGTQLLLPPVAKLASPPSAGLDLRDAKASVERPLEIAASGGHDLLMMRFNFVSPVRWRMSGVEKAR